MSGNNNRHFSTDAPGHVTVGPEEVMNLGASNFIVSDEELQTSVPAPHRGRVPLNYDPQGFMQIFAGKDRTVNLKKLLAASKAQVVAKELQEASGAEEVEIEEPEPSAAELGFMPYASGWKELPEDIQRENIIQARITKKIPQSSVAGAGGNADITGTLGPVPFTPEEYISQGSFDALAEQFKNAEGGYAALTAYGSVPLPNDITRHIPEKFVADPIIEERELFVHKEDIIERETDLHTTQMDYQFVPVQGKVYADLIKTIETVRKIEVPKITYNPVIEDRLIEVPQGVKYVEVPVEVECRYPARLIPVPKEQIIERVIETTKPVHQYKIIEVPKIVKQKVTKTVVKEIPYVVPDYVEKIVEVPYRPDMRNMPAPHGCPMEYIPRPPPLPQPGQEAEAFRSLKTGPVPGTARLPSGDHSGSTEGQIDLHASMEALKAPAPPIGFGDLPAEEGPIVLGKEGSSIVPTVEGETVVMPAVDKPQVLYASAGVSDLKLPYDAKIDISVVQIDDVPEGVAIAQPGVSFIPPGPFDSSSGSETLVTRGGGGVFESCCGPPLGSHRLSTSTASVRGDESVVPPTVGTAEEDTTAAAPAATETTVRGWGKPVPRMVYAGSMDPIIAHAPPGMGHVQYRNTDATPQLLTRLGVKDLQQYMNQHHAHTGEQLLPPLAPHPGIPMNHKGVVDVRQLNKITEVMTRHSWGDAPNLLLQRPQYAPDVDPSMFVGGPSEEGVPSPPPSAAE